jgi:uncharacterized protein YecE (DUF72 family)
MDQLWNRFQDGLAPLREAGKLGWMLFQFPPWFVYNDKNLEHVALCAQKMQGHRLAVEFRQPTWFAAAHRDATLAFLREHGLIHVVVDEPQGLKDSLPQVWEITSADAAYVRLFGRHVDPGEGREAMEDRYKYLYNERELDELAEQIERLARTAAVTHITFNNTHLNWAQQNARELQEKLERAML